VKRFAAAERPAESEPNHPGQQAEDRHPPTAFEPSARRSREKR